jgi:septal ring factor EnvC (AmiA/AmiB activator)
MNRFLTILNLAGVLAVATLCITQWHTNSQLDAQVRTLNKTCADQQDKITEQAQTIKEDAADLEDVHQRLSLAEDQLADTQQKLALRNAEYEQLRSTLKKWIQAVADRDAALKQAGVEIRQIAAERNDAIQKFNDLATKYNAVVTTESKQ